MFSDIISGTLSPKNKKFNVTIILLLCCFLIKSVSGQLQVDTNGWTIIPSSNDTRTIYVSNSEGNDENNGLSVSTPVKTIAHGAELLRDGNPDHLLLKRGDTWILSEGLGSFLSGRNATEPLVVSYYGEEGSRPLIKTERGFMRVRDGEIRSNLAFIGIEFYAYKHDPNSPDYDSERGVSGISYIGAKGENLLIEDCKFNYMQMGAYTTGQGGEGNLKNFKFRRNIIIHSWAGGSSSRNDNGTRVQGMFIFGVDGILIEENLFDHNGWDEQIEGAGACMFNHNIYMATQNPNSEKIIVKGNIIARASANGLHLRSGGFVEDNLFIRNAVNLVVGYFLKTSMPGAFAEVRNNVFQEVRMMDKNNTEYPRSNATRGIGGINIPAKIENNIFSHCLNEALIGIDVYDDKWGFGGYLQTRDNIIYKWMRKDDKPKPEWPEPERTVASYHESIGKEASTISFLLTARERPLKEWWPEYSAYNVNNYIREGFNLKTAKN